MRLVTTNYKNLKIKQQLLWMGTLALVVVLVWTGMSVYQRYYTSTVDPAIEKMRTPLNSNLDIETAQKLRYRQSPPQEFTIIKIIDNQQVIESDLPNTENSSSNPQLSANSMSSSPSAQLR